MTADDLERRLTEAGGASVDRPDPRFVVRLETTLRTAHASRALPWWRQPRLFVPLGLGAAAAASVLALVLAAPPVADVTADGGFAGSVTVEPTVDGDDDSPTSSPSTSAGGVVPETSTPSPDVTVGTDDSTTTSAVADPEPDPDPGASSSTTPATVTTTGPNAAPSTTRTTAAPSPSSSTSTSSPPTTDSVATTEPSRTEFRATAAKTDAGVEIRWSRLVDDRVAGYRVYRVAETADGERRQLIASRRASGERVAVDETDRRFAYVVHAIDADGRVLDATNKTRA